jgi:division protein CdvB (Snf7/Vps24/ESCRT-III family)
MLGIMDRWQKIKPTRESFNELRKQSIRIEQANWALGQRDRALFDMVRKAIEENDGEHATMYANELSRVRRIKAILTQSQLAVDCIMIRLENFLDLEHVVEEMKPISDVIRGVSSEVQDVVPQFASVLDQLNSVAGEALIETTIDMDQPVLEDVLNSTSQGGAAILGEVSGIVEGSLRESFPEPPLVVARAASPEAEAISYGSPAEPRGQGEWGDITDEVSQLINRANTRSRAKWEALI